MAPQDDPAAFKDGESFIGGTDDYLRLLVGKIILRIEKELVRPPTWREIAGYSLAGLFVLYVIYRTDAFSRVGRMSAFLWFPDFKECIFSHGPERRLDCICFSLRDKEIKTRSPVLRTAQENTEETQTFYQSKSIDTMFQLNPGNHFVHGLERTTAGTQWLSNRQAAVRGFLFSEQACEKLVRPSHRKDLLNRYGGSTTPKTQSCEKTLPGRDWQTPTAPGQEAFLTPYSTIIRIRTRGSNRFKGVKKHSVPSGKYRKALQTTTKNLAQAFGSKLGLIRLQSFGPYGVSSQDLSIL